MSTLEEVIDSEKAPPGKGLLAIMNETGHLKVIWDKNNPDEVTMAKKNFDEMKKKGYAGFSVKKDGEPDKVVHDFDPDAECIIMRPAQKGG